MYPVLFASQRPYERAENIRTVYDAYDGEKEFITTDASRRHPLIRSGKFHLMVIDEYPEESPGKCIVLWHAIDGGKTVGYDQPGPYLRPEHSKLIDYISTSGTGTAQIISSNSGVPIERVLPVGLPRTDAYVGKKKGDGHTVLAGRRSYLFAPTFRNRRETSMPNFNFEWLDSQLSDDELLVVKAHPCSSSFLGSNTYRHIIEISKDEPSTNYLIDCDVVITDYSSIIFDGYLLGKPSVLIEKTPGFLSTRGMYFKYPSQYSSRFCDNEKDMLWFARCADGLTETERWCISRVADMCDGHATERVIKLIKEMNDEQKENINDDENS